MFFITNREPIDSISSEKLPRPFEFNLGVNSPSNSVFFCKVSKKAKTKKEKEKKADKGKSEDFNYTSAEIGSKEFMKELRGVKAKQILLFIHGFSNLPETDIFPRAEKLQKLFDSTEKNLVQVVSLIWPCDNDLGIVKDYWDDQKSADQSAFSFARILQKFMKWRDDQPEDDPCLKRINILAHSMGNRVLRESLEKWNQYDLASGVPLLFRNTILMAADIVNESLEDGEKGRIISHASRNVSVYFASDDFALRSSKVSNLKNKVASRRLGHTGPEDMEKVLKNVYAIDCDNFNNRYDKPKGHSYFLEDNNNMPGKVFKHMFETIKSGRVFVDDQENRTHILGKEQKKKKT